MNLRAYKRLPIRNPGSLNGPAMCYRCLSHYNVVDGDPILEWESDRWGSCNCYGVMGMMVPRERTNAASVRD